VQSEIIDKVGIEKANIKRTRNQIYQQRISLKENMEKKFSASVPWRIFEMPPARKSIEFEGYFAEGVLGIFKIIRGFADLWDLAAISIPYELSDGAEPVQVIGHQRRLNEKHARDIKKIP
jgi:hypothetical protein